MWSSTSRRGNSASDVCVKSLSAFVLLGFSQRLFLPDVSEWRGGITTFSPSRRNSGGHEGMLLIRTDSVQLGKEKENVFKWRCLYTELFIYLKTIWMLGWFSLVSVSSCDVTVFGVCVFFFFFICLNCEFWLWSLPGWGWIWICSLEKKQRLSVRASTHLKSNERGCAFVGTRKVIKLMSAFHFKGAMLYLRSLFVNVFTS